MDPDVAVIGAGVVGSAVALALGRRGVEVALLEAERAPGLGASGTNSGILHTGFDSPPGELETRLILRGGELRDPVVEALGVPVRRCGAVLHGGQARVLAANAERNGVPVSIHEDGSLAVPGEAVTDPVAYTVALAAAAERLGVVVRTRFPVAAIEAGIVQSEGGERLRARLVVNCAGLFADQVARLAGDDSFEIYPRKGEFLVFDPPDGAALREILLPVPSERTKGVLVFPTVDGKVVAGPTAVDCEDKHDWSVRPEAREEIIPKAVGMFPPLESAEPVAAYAGLRPAGRGLNYLVEPSRTAAGLINVAAIRSTGLTASLGIAEHVSGLVEKLGIPLGEERALEPGNPPPVEGPWWRRTAEHRAA